METEQTQVEATKHYYGYYHYPVFFRWVYYFRFW